MNKTLRFWLAISGIVLTLWPDWGVLATSVRYWPVNPLVVVLANLVWAAALCCLYPWDLPERPDDYPHENL